LVLQGWVRCRNEACLTLGVPKHWFVTTEKKRRNREKGERSWRKEGRKEGGKEGREEYPAIVSFHGVPFIVTFWAERQRGKLRGRKEKLREKMKERK
jgi:hypothetical protein